MTQTKYVFVDEQLFQIDGEKIKLLESEIFEITQQYVDENEDDPGCWPMIENGELSLGDFRDSNGFCFDPADHDIPNTVDMNKIPTLFILQSESQKGEQREIVERWVEFGFPDYMLN